MNIPIASCSQQKAAGIQKVLCLCTVDTHSVLLACFGTVNLFVLRIDEDAIEVEHIYVMNLKTPANKLRHVSSIGMTFVLSNSVLYSVSLRKDIGDSLQETVELTKGKVLDFDLVIVKDAVFISVLEGHDISIFAYNSEGNFFLRSFSVGNMNSCNWITPDCLCCSEEKVLHIFSAEGSYMIPLGSKATPAHYAVPLLEYFSSDKVSSTVKKKNSFIVLFESSGAYFVYHLALYYQEADIFTEAFRFSIFPTSLPLSIFSLGPWICVGGMFGLEFYDYKTGSCVQSCLETESFDVFSFANVSFDTLLVPNDRMYSRPRFGIAVTKKGLYTLRIRSVLDIVNKLKNDGVFHRDLLRSLKRFGESVQATEIMKTSSTSSCPCDTKLCSSNMLSSDYGLILAKFRILLWRIDPEGKKHMSNNKRSSSSLECSICESKCFLSLQLNECVLCHSLVCQKCLCTRNLRLYGYTNMNSRSIICLHCDGRCDFNLYRLFMARRYNQILYYMETYPERCYRLSLSEVIPCVLHECFEEGKFELCAALLEKYVPAHDNLWEEWVQLFSLNKQIRYLAYAHNPNHADKSVNASLLLQLVKGYARDLYALLLQQYTPVSYHIEVVMSGITSRLSFKKQEAQYLQDSRQTCVLTLVEWQNAISGLYFDEDIIFLLRSYLHICFENGKYMDAAKCYMEYFVMMLPYTQERQEQQRRGIGYDEVVENSAGGDGDGDIVCKKPLYAFSPSHLIDLWDLLISHNLLEEFIHIRDSSGTTFFLTPLLIHYRDEFRRYLMDSPHTDFLRDILQATVSELKDNQPIQLLYVLDCITIASPSITSLYHLRMVELYLEYAPEKLFSFIQHPQVCGLNWKKLAKVVEERKMFRELIYIVGKTGNDVEAVRMAVRCMKNVPLAMEYIKDHPGDSRLWNVLTTNVIQSPILLGDFIEAAGDDVDMKLFLQSIPIPNCLCIPHGGPRLKKLFKNKSCFQRIVKSSVDSIAVDNYASLMRLRQRNCKGIRCIPGALCHFCGQSIEVESMVVAVVDSSGRSFHSGCTPSSYVHNMQEKRCVVKKKRTFQNGRSGTNDKGLVAEINDMVEYNNKKSLGAYNIIKLLPEKQIYRIFSFLSPREREICRNVSRGFRKAIGSFYIFSKREDDNIFSRYYARLEDVGEKNCRCTVCMGGGVPVFNSLRRKV